MQTSFSVARVAKFSALYVAATLLAGLVARLVLPRVGVEWGDIDSAHPFLRNIWFALPAWSAVLWVYWLLARRYPASYWYSAVSISLASNGALWVLLVLTQPMRAHQLGTSYALNALYQEAIVINLAALLSRRVKFKWDNQEATNPADT
jgi:hypothetical protein